jgi:hypothetical protein
MAKKKKNKTKKISYTFKQLIDDKCAMTLRRLRGEEEPEPIVEPQLAAMIDSESVLINSDSISYEDMESELKQFWESAMYG